MTHAIDALISHWKAEGDTGSDTDLQHEALLHLEWLKERMTEQEAADKMVRQFGRENAQPL